MKIKVMLMVLGLSTLIFLSGCRYPIHWFTNIKEFGVEVIKELPQKDWKQIDLFNLAIISKLDR